VHLPLEPTLAGRQAVIGGALQQAENVAQHPARRARPGLQQRRQRALAQRADGGIDQFLGQVRAVESRCGLGIGQRVGGGSVAHRRHTNRGDGRV
jgi:hypothetical protein